MGQPDPDFDEIVLLTGRGQMTLRTAIREVMSMPASPPGAIRQTSLFRDAGKETAIYDFEDIKRLAAVLDEAEGRDRRTSLILALRTEGLSLEQIGREVGLCGERVRQIIGQAERKAARNARIRAKWSGVFTQSA